MLNQSVLVGRVKDLIFSENGVTRISVSVPRSFKNENGEYDIDILNCIVSKFLASKGSTYLKVGDLIGIKGRLQVQDNLMELVAEKITFLSTNNSESN